MVDDSTIHKEVDGVAALWKRGNIDVPQVDDFVRSLTSEEKSVYIHDLICILAGKPSREDQILSTALTNYDMSAQLAKAFETDDIVYFGDLAAKTTGELLSIPGLGKKYLEEALDIVRCQEGFSLDMSFPDWVRPDGTEGNSVSTTTVKN